MLKPHRWIKPHAYRLLISISLLILLPTCKKADFIKLDTLAVTPFNSLNTAKKVAMLSYLTMIANSDSMIAGQYIGQAEPGAPYFDPDLFYGLSRKPGVLATDMGYWTDFSAFSSEYMPSIINAADSGSLITICMYMPNPFNRKYGDSFHDKKKYNYPDVYTAGTRANDRLMILLNNAGNLLQQLKDRNIIVLLRPYLEMNGGWFWWGDKKDFPTQDQFKTLWIYTYNYFENVRQLDNLLWVYGPNYQGNDAMKSTTYYYPGTDYVDIVGLSYYHNDLSQIDTNQSMTALMALNKPICMSEIGPKNTGRIDKNEWDNLTYLGLNKYPVSYFVVWSSWRQHYMAIRDSKNADALMNHDLIISQDEVHY